jgi:hypothetical protein
VVDAVIMAGIETSRAAHSGVEVVDTSTGA